MVRLCQSQRRACDLSPVRRVRFVTGEAVCFVVAYAIGYELMIFQRNISQ